MLVANASVQNSFSPKQPSSAKNLSLRVMNSVNYREKSKNFFIDISNYNY